ncbi:MAG: CGGC domain-containing protein [Desulfobacterales bacterium]
MKIAFIRCEKNENRCPLTNCLKCMMETKEGFAEYENCYPAGVFTCRCPGDNIPEQAKILKAKGAEAIHFVTCSFAKKTDEGWIEGNGFCDHLEDLMEAAHKASGLTCVKGTAHLPEGYKPEILK